MIIRDKFCCFCIEIYAVTPSSEPSHRDGSDEGSHHMASMMNMKNYPSVISKYLPPLYHIVPTLCIGWEDGVISE